MARYTGPKTRISRKFGKNIYGYDKNYERKKYPPGQHGKRIRRGIGFWKNSEYGIQLFEKQKAKYTYGILERQFLNMFKNASKKKGITGNLLLQMCESRLDNVVYRLGFSYSRPGARQLVCHKHIMVNGKVINIPSYQLKPGDIISLKEKYIKNQNQKSLNNIENFKEKWLVWNNKKKIGIFKKIPKRKEIFEIIDEKLIVELYSK
jgi:small subunit ribosomal protein S4